MGELAESCGRWNLPPGRTCPRTIHIAIGLVLAGLVVVHLAQRQEGDVEAGDPAAPGSDIAPSRGPARSDRRVVGRRDDESSWVPRVLSRMLGFRFLGCL